MTNSNLFANWQQNLLILQKFISPQQYQVLCQWINDHGSLLVNHPLTPEDFTIQGRRGLPVHLFNPHNPTQDAQQRIHQWLEERHRQLSDGILMIGSSALLELETLLNQLQESHTYLLIEPEIEMLARTIFFRNLDFLIQDKHHILIFLGDNLQQLKEALGIFLKNVVHLDLSIFVHPVYYTHRNQLIAQYLDTLNIAVRIEVMNRGTMASFGEEWFQNILCNLHAYLYQPDLCYLRNLFQDWDGVMVAAGPTLDQSIDYLYQIQDKVLIAAVGQAYRRLQKAGIRPDFVVAIDSDPRTYQQFKDVEQDNAYLVGGDNIFPPILSHFDQRIFLTSSVLEEVRTWLHPYGFCQQWLAVGGTVSLSAIDLLALCGCPRIFLLGLDLCFRDDGTTHASHTQWSHYRADVSSLVKVPGNHRSYVLTSRQFEVYIQLINNYIARNPKMKDRKVYNVNPDGAKIEGTEVILPSQLSNFYQPNTTFAKQDLWKTKLQGIPLPSKDQLLSAIDKALNELKEIQKILQKSIRKATQLISNVYAGRSLQKYIRSLDQYDKKLAQYSTGLSLTNCAVRTLCMDIVLRKGGTIEDQTRFYNHLYKGTEWLEGLLNKAKQKVTEIPR